MKTIQAVFSFVVVFLLVGCGGSGLYQPSFQVENKVSDEEMNKDIVAALNYRGWYITDEQPNKIFATYKIGNKHSANIAIPYGKNSYAVQYVSSAGLKYSKSGDKESIHQAYTKWVLQLQGSINANLAIVNQPFTAEAKNPQEIKNDMLISEGHYKIYDGPRQKTKEVTITGRIRTANGKRIPNADENTFYFLPGSYPLEIYSGLKGDLIFTEKKVDINVILEAGKHYIIIRKFVEKDISGNKYVFGLQER